MSNIDEFVIRLRNYAEYHNEREIYELADELEVTARSNQTQQIKPLVWKRHNSAVQSAKSTVSEFTCTQVGTSFFAFCGDRLQCVCPSEGEAKEWCKQEYERRVRECLQ